MTQIVLPNVRKIFIPDPGFIMFEADLKGADAQVVAWEADDDDLKNAFRSGLDVHVKNAEDMWGSQFTRLSGHARNAKRQENKVAVHATNYGASSRTLAISLGWTVRDAESFQRRWFGLHPRIKSNFHNRIHSQLLSGRTVTNAFGYRRVFFDRSDSCFAEALAWIPQSTVAHNTFIGALQLERKFWPHQLDRGYRGRDLEGLLLQTHDSINFQFRLSSVPLIAELRSALAVVTPYPDPLVIPWELKSSTKSWGDLQEV